MRIMPCPKLLLQDNRTRLQRSRRRVPSNERISALSGSIGYQAISFAAHIDQVRGILRVLVKRLA